MTAERDIISGSRQFEYDIFDLSIDNLKVRKSNVFVLTNSNSKFFIEKNVKIKM